MSKKFSFFISHSSATEEIARHLYFNSMANGLYPWYDESLLKVGDVLEEEIKSGIDNSEGFVLLHSKEAMEKEWVPKEMEIAKVKKMEDPNFKIKVIKLDDERFIDDFWNKFVYLEWINSDIPGSIIKLIEAVTEKKVISEISFSASLNNIEIYTNKSHTVAEHARNYILYNLSCIKNLIDSVVLTAPNEELRDTFNKVLKLHLIDLIPKIQGGVILISPGIREYIYGNRKRVPPRISVDGLPSKYSWEVKETNEIFSRILIFEKETNEPISYPVPMILSFDSEL